MATKKMKGTAEAVRGNERIQQLMEEFPEIPRSLVAKMDLYRARIDLPSKQAVAGSSPVSRSKSPNSNVKRAKKTAGKTRRS